MRRSKHRLVFTLREPLPMRYWSPQRRHRYRMWLRIRKRQIEEAFFWGPRSDSPPGLAYMSPYVVFTPREHAIVQGILGYA